MSEPLISRRGFFHNAGAAAITGWGALALGSGATPARPMRLGGPVFVKSDDPAVLAQAHRELGYRAAYAPDVDLRDKDRIKAIIREFAARDVAIAEVGAWVNMLDPDPEKRRKNLEYVTERMALAEELGARCCVDIAGSYNPDVWYGPHPENFSRRFFDATVENVRKVIDAVKPHRTTFTVEMMGWCQPSGADEYADLIKAVDRKAFAVHLDVCNVINSPARMYNNAAVIRACFRKLGQWIVSCHAKDVAWEVELQVHFKEVIPGRGLVDYRAYLSELSKLPVDAPLMLEHLKTAEEYAEGRRYIQGIAGELGLSFGAERT
jgi:sugar phosphate isomerase/epimerase